MKLIYDVARLEELERSWDARLGGPLTRPYRDLLCYCAGRLLSQGAQLEDIAGYLRIAFDEAVAALELGQREQAGGET